MIFAALRLGHASSAFEKLTHVTCCQFGKRMPARLGAWFDHVRTLSDLVDLFIAGPGQKAENYVLESYEANAHLHQLGMIGRRAAKVGTEELHGVAVFLLAWTAGRHPL